MQDIFRHPIHLFDQIQPPSDPIGRQTVILFQQPHVYPKNKIQLCLTRNRHSISQQLFQNTFFGVNSVVSVNDTSIQRAR